MTALVSVIDWFTLGVYLGVEYHTPKKIEIEKRNEIDRCKIDMLGEWLASSPGDFHRLLTSTSTSDSLRKTHFTHEYL